MELNSFPLMNKCGKYSCKKSFLEIPKKAELTENESIEQQEKVINRKYQDPIGNTGS